MQTQLELKAIGMKLAADANRQWLNRARSLALALGSIQEFVSIEDIRAEWPYENVPFGNWAGSIFKGGDWEYVRHIKATHKGSHGRVVSVWKFTK